VPVAIVTGANTGIGLATAVALARCGFDLSLPAGVLRGAAWATWRARLQPTPPGWLDLALNVPIMDIARAREELGWQPRHGAGEPLLELLDGIRDGAGMPTPPLEPRSGGPLRVREVLGGVGGAAR